MTKFLFVAMLACCLWTVQSAAAIPSSAEEKLDRSVTISLHTKVGTACTKWRVGHEITTVSQLKNFLAVRYDIPVGEQILFV